MQKPRAAPERGAGRYRRFPRSGPRRGPVTSSIPPISPAGTRPRWRDGRANAGSAGRAPSTARPGRWRATALASNARCLPLPTRLKMTPVTGNSGRCSAKPRNRAAAEAPCPRASTMSTTGQPVIIARSAVEPASPPGPAPSKRPIAPSHKMKSAAAPSPATRPARVSRRIAQGSRLTHGPPLAAAWKPGSMKSGPALAAATRSPRRRRWRSSPAAISVLPLPEAGAAMIRPGAGKQPAPPTCP